MGISDRLGGLSGSVLFASEHPASKPAFSRGAAAAAAAPVAPEKPRTIKRNQYAGKCVNCGSWIGEQAGLLVKTPEGKWGVKHDELSPCSTAPAPKPVKAEVVGSGIEITSLDLRSLPAGYYSNPNSDNRLKVLIQKPGKGAWEGWIFVKDGAEYGTGQRYGSQKPGATYRGKIVSELEAILADPRAASARYGQITSTCGICGRPLETEESVARGIGPKCAERFG